MSRVSNIDFLMEFTNGDVKAIEEFIEIFLNDIPESINNILKALENKDFNVLAFMAHKLRSSLKIFGMIHLDPTLEKIELLSKAKSEWEIIRILTLKAVSVFNNAVAEMQQELNNIRSIQ